MPISTTKQSLIKLPRPIKRGSVIFCDICICGFSVWFAFGLRLDQWDFFQGKQWIVFFVVLLFSLPLFYIYGLYKAIFRYIGTTAFLSIIHLFAVYTAIFFCIFTLFGIDEVPRSIGVIQPILLFIGIGVSRYFVRYWLGNVNTTQKLTKRNQSKALIFGAGAAGRQLATTLSSNREILIVGFIDDDSNLVGSMINGIPIYSSRQLQDVILQKHIRDVLLAMPSASQERRREIIASLSGSRVRVRTLPGLNDIGAPLINASNLRDLDMNELLGRPEVHADPNLLKKNILNRVVLVTGAGGSIGSELCRQIMKFSPKSLILIDSSESNLYAVYEELKTISIHTENSLLGEVLDDKASPLYSKFSTKLTPYLASVRNSDLVNKIFRDHRPSLVFHAAAYKHVPLVEQNIVEGIQNNVFGTLACARASLEYGVENFILVSTDKAVRPTNVMGASKRIAEMLLQAMAQTAKRDNRASNFSMVRFGNVLGSSGSVVPLFRAQIASGGPVTLTHPDVTRYFMTIPEAAQLVIQASSMATGGEVFLLDMGEPVRIYDLAIKMIYLSGLLLKDEGNSDGDIEIKVVGLRTGEKLYEELLIGDNPELTSHPKIMMAQEDFLSWAVLEQELDKLNLALNKFDESQIVEIVKRLVPGYLPSNG